MSIVQKFNGLNGAVVTRKRIQRIIDLAKKENDVSIIYRLSKVLNDNPDTNKFKLTVKAYPTGLKAAHHAGAYKEALDNCGRLRPGYKFDNGAVIKVKPKKKVKPVAAVKPKPVVKKVTPKIETPKKKESKPTAFPSVKKKPVSDGSKTIKFILPDLPEKYDRAIYTSSISELDGYASRSDEPLSTAAKNMRDLVNAKLFDLLYFKDGYGRQNAPATYRNVPSVYQRLLKRDIEDIEVKKLEYLLEKYKEYQYKTAWLSYSFRGKPSREIYNTVKANIRTIERTLLTLNGLKGHKKQIRSTRKSTGLKGIIPEPKDLIEASKEPMQICAPKSNNPRVMKIGSAGNDNPAQYYTVAGEVGKFLQAVERKPVGSVVITMDGEQGAGKTTTLYKFMQAFAEPGSSCLFLSLEEHPNSDLAKQKVNKYLSPEVANAVDTVAEVKDKEDLYDLIKDYEIIFIDSWQKLLRMVGTIRLDEDLRKKFDGKVFVIIFQQTTTGRTKGGAEVVFDGDIITKMVKEDSFSDNYAYFDKNRYTKVPLETLHYNIASGTCYNPEEPEKALQQPVAIEKQALTFEVV